MKILFLARQLNYGGSERQLVALAKALHKNHHRITVVVFYPNGPLEKDLRAEGVRVRSLDKRGRWHVLSFFWRLIKTIREEQPEIIHSYLGVQNIVTAFAVILLPSVRVAWGVRASNMDLTQYDWLARVLYRVERLLSRRADLIVANSYAGLNYAAANGFPKEKMLVIPNGIDTEWFRPDLRARARVRAEWGVDDETELIGMVARLDPMKDHETFLRAAALLVPDRERVSFVCVGTGQDEYTQHLVALGEQLGLSGRLIWAGAQKDMPDVYNALDLMVSSSSFGEGFSNVIGEAMACGVPCVATDLGDSKRIIGDLGAVVPIQNPEELKVAIEKSLEKIDAGTAPHIRQRIVTLFSVAELTTRSERALFGLIKERGNV